MDYEEARQMGQTERSGNPDDRPEARKEEAR